MRDIAKFPVAGKSAARPGASHAVIWALALTRPASCGSRCSHASTIPECYVVERDHQHAVGRQAEHPSVEMCWLPLTSLKSITRSRSTCDDGLGPARCPSRRACRIAAVRVDLLVSGRNSSAGGGRRSLRLCGGHVERHASAACSVWALTSFLAGRDVDKSPLVGRDGCLRQSRSGTSPKTSTPP